jgi:hypothetical protein
VTEAKDGSVSLTEALGLTQEEIDGYKTKMEAATGITDEYSKAADSQITLMDKIKAKFSEITLKMSSFLEPLQPILAGMTALGPVMIFLGSATGVATVKWIAHTAAMVASTVAMVAVKAGVIAWTVAQTALDVVLNANPIGVIILAIGALIAIVVLLVKNWDHVSAFFVTLWDGIKALFWTVVDWVKEWGVLFLGPVGFIIKYWDELVDFFKKIPERIGAAFEKVKDFILAPFRAAWHGIETGINWLIGALNKISFKFPSWVPGLGGKEWGINIPEVNLPEFSQGGPIPERTMLYGMQSQRAYAMADAGESVTPRGGREITIRLESWDGKLLAKAVAPEMVNLIRLKTGVRI